MATSCTTRVRQGIETIANADGPIGTVGTLRYLCNRTTNIVLPWRSAVTALKPVIAMTVSANNRTGGTGDRRRVQVLCTAFAEGNGAQAKAEALTQRLREILTPGAFQALTPTLDAVVTDYTDRNIDDEGVAIDSSTPTLIGRSDLDLILWVTAAQ